MKRDTYTIEYSGLIARKFSWNSAIRETESITRNIARAERVYYRLKSRTCDAAHTRMVSHWQSEKGKDLIFTIQKIQD